jgi:hypothetical protein
MPYADLLTDAEISAAMRAIVEFDQYDDWIPDPVHFEDTRASLGRPAPLFDRVRRAAPDPSHVEFTSLARRSASPLAAASLPLDFRVQVNAATTRIARRITSKLARDRVLGFTYRPGSAQLFSPPGEGIIELVDGDGLAGALLFRANEAIVLDVKGASANSSWARLKTILIDASAGIQDVDAVGRAYGRAGSLPTGDDAWAFLANYVFRPVDQALIAAKVDFYRVRDEYVVFNLADSARVRNALAGAGFSAVAATPLSEGLADDYEFKLSQKCDSSDNPDSVEMIAQSTSYYDVIATLRCGTSDSAELSVLPHGPLAADKAANMLINRLRSSWDAIDMSPILRPIWSSRRTTVLRRAPSSTPYRNTLANRKGDILNALRQARASGEPWIAHVTSVLASDLGPLAPEDLQALQAYAAQPHAVLGGAAARTALARSSTLPADRILPPGFPHVGHPIGRRWGGLAALYLAQREIGQPLAAWVQAARGVEPQLADMLSAAGRVG